MNGEALARDVVAAVASLAPAVVAYVTPFLIVAVTLMILRGRVGAWLGAAGSEAVPYAWTAALVVGLLSVYGAL